MHVSTAESKAQEPTRIKKVARADTNIKGLKHFLYFLGKTPGTIAAKYRRATFNTALLTGRGHHRTLNVEELFVALLFPLKIT